MKMMNKLYLSDMDGTLTKGSIVLDHAGHLIEKGLIKDDGSFKAWKLDPKNERLIVAVAENYRHQLKGKSIDELDVQGFIANEIANESKWYSTLQLLKEAKAKGHEVIIISGSSDFLVEEVAKQLGFKGVGSKYLLDENGKLSGEIVGMFGEESKDEYIKGLDLNNKQVVGLGDTGADNGIFKNAHYNILVDPTSETMEYLLKVGAKIDSIVRE